MQVRPSAPIGFTGATTYLTARGPVFEGRGAFIDSSNVNGYVQAGREVTVINSIVNGYVQAGREITATNSTLQGDAQAGREMTLTNVLAQRGIKAGRDLMITGSQISGHSQSGRDATVISSTLVSLSVGRDVSLRGSTIAGLLEAASNELIIIDSQVGSLRLNPGLGNDLNVMVFNGAVGSFSTIGQVTVIGSTPGGSRISMGGGSIVMTAGGGVSISGNNVRVGVGGQTNVNGFQISGSLGRTTVVTPEGSVYVNGAKVSGDGANTFADYKTTNSRTPNIDGPGWSDGARTSGGQAAVPQEPTQVIILRGNSSISGIVVFVGGNGKIVVERGAQFTGTVQGGVVERK